MVYCGNLEFRKVGYNEECNLFQFATMNRRQRKTIPDNVRLVVVWNVAIFTVSDKICLLNARKNNNNNYFTFNVFGEPRF